MYLLGFSPNPLNAFSINFFSTLSTSLKSQRTLRSRYLNLKLLFKNPRNTASGSIKLLDSDEVARRPLQCFLYSIVSDQIKTKNHSELLKVAREMGFDVPKYERVVDGLNGVREIILIFGTKINQTEDRCCRIS